MEESLREKPRPTLKVPRRRARGSTCGSESVVDGEENIGDSKCDESAVELDAAADDDDTAAADADADTDADIDAAAAAAAAASVREDEVKLYIRIR